MARPKTPPNEQLSHCIMLRLTQTQYDLIRTLADYMKIPLADTLIPVESGPKK